MVREYYPHPDVKIVPLRDHPHSNRLWSEQLDALIEESFPDMSAVLYGSRDSFIPLYTGHFPTHEVPQLSKINGTSVRSELSFPKSADARAAIIFAEQKRPAFTYATCDLAIRDPKTEMVLLTGKREHSGLLAFLGGHAEKSDGDARTTAMREQQEEVRGVTLSSPVYIGSEIIDDPRYKNSADSVMTTFFAADYEGGKPTPSDDVHSVRWVHPRDFAQVLVPWHQKLGSLYREYYEV
jgi:bifunctional NMN adenylyltransferase/nudix hydrolase